MRLMQIPIRVGWISYRDSPFSCKNEAACFTFLDRIYVNSSCRIHNSTKAAPAVGTSDDTDTSHKSQVVEEADRWKKRGLEGFPLCENQKDIASRELQCQSLFPDYCSHAMGIRQSVMVGKIIPLSHCRLE